MSGELVILVDAHDRPIGTVAKLEAHEKALLHRAFSVFLFDAAGKLLLQRRAAGKYHSGGLWSNTCCSHPRPGEDTAAAARRRLREEMGIDCALVHALTFTYRAELPGGLVEHEVDHVFAGRFDGEPRPDAAEVADAAWRDVAELRAAIAAAPERYAPWLAPALERLVTAGYPDRIA